MKYSIIKINLKHFMEKKNMEQVFESDNIQFVKVNESLVRDYLTMINDIEHVARFISKRIKPISEEMEVNWVCRNNCRKTKHGVWNGSGSCNYKI